MSPRRQDSQETLFDGLGGDDRLDGTLPLFLPPDRACGSVLPFYLTPDVHHRSKGMPQDPFLVVTSLNDSVLVKQGLVEETTLPPPTHSAYDIQVCFACDTLPIPMIEHVIL